MGRTPSAVLDDLETEWAPHMRAVSLVAELQFEPGQIRLAARCLGMTYHTLRFEPGPIRLRRLMEFPASAIVAMSGIGALEYQAGNFWSSFFERAHLRQDGNAQAEWGELFLRALDRFRCPVFADNPRKYVGPILLHAGVPAYCLSDLIDLVVKRLEADQSLDGSRFVHWARAGGRDSRLSTVDMPVQYFLRDAGEFAVDWIDRLVDLIDRLGEPAPDLDGVRLPEWVVTHVTKHLEGSRRRGPRRKTMMGRGSEGARLALDPFGIGVHLVLPAVGDQPDGMATWHVTLDGEPQLVRTRAAWPGSSATAPGTTVTLTRPVRAVAVRLGDSTLTMDVDVIDSQDPMLVFGDDGRRLPATLPLPPEPVWLLRPEDLLLRAAGGAVAHLGVGVAPYGWDGWALERVDLSAAHGIAVGDSKIRPVRGTSRARLELDHPVSGAVSAFGSAVYSSPPTVVLPATPGAVVGWSIVVRRPGESPLHSRDLDIDGETRIDPFREMPRPLLGTYQVLVRGPLGRGLSRELLLVEGLRVTSDPPWREFVPNGLVAAQVVLEASPALRLSPTSTFLGAAQDAFAAEVSVGERAEVLEISPHHMVVAQASVDGEAIRWQPKPLRLETERLSRTEVVAVRMPEQIAEGSVLLFRNNELVQSTPIHTGAGGVARLDARRFSDSMGATGSGQLELELLGRRIPLALIRPRTLATKVEFDARGVLSLVEGADVADLAAGVYCLFKPWRMPLEVRFIDGEAGPLPELVGCGDLLVHVRVDDPWLPLSWPEWPEGANTFRCPAPLQGSASDWERCLSGWLAGTQDLVFDKDAIEPMLRVYALRDELLRAHVRAPIAQELLAILEQATPAQVASACAASGLRRRDIAAVAVNAGLTEQPADGNGPEPDAALWLHSPIMAVCAASPHLSSGHAGLLEDLQHAAGPDAWAILAGMPDPHPTAARFGPDALQLSTLAPEILDTVWRAANIVPASLLDVDSRVTAARQLFDARKRSGLKRASTFAAAAADDLRGFLADAGHFSCVDAIDARTSETGWQSLPATSLALACVARVAARGDLEAQSRLNRWKSVWPALAKDAPDLVEIDIVLAECLLLGASRDPND